MTAESVQKIEEALSMARSNMIADIIIQHAEEDRIRKEELERSKPIEELLLKARSRMIVDLFLKD